MLDLLTPLKVIRHPSASLKGFPGESVPLHITVINQGGQSAVIEVFLNPISPTPLHWCSEDKQRITLDPQQATEVSLQFELPEDAVPGSYPYILVVDSPEHYPEDTPIQQPSHLEILAHEQKTERVETATIFVSPVTSPAQPILVEPGIPQSLTVQIHNRSSRVDRFRLSCLDIEPNWLQIQYPCLDMKDFGLLSNTDGLELNPGEKGEIIVDFQFPEEIPAGHYSPTLQLLSENTDQIELDVVYLEVKPEIQLGVELETLLGKVTRSAGLYRLKLTNHGNVIRELAFSAISRGEKDCCDYVFEPESVRLLMGETAEVSLTVSPNQKGRRPFFGYGLDLPFQIQLTDRNSFTIPETLPTGHLIWKARPWWQFILLILACITAVTGAGALIWLTFFRPAPSPILDSFKSDSPQYTEGDRVRLNWTVANIQEVKTITVSSIKDETPSESQSYSFEEGVPTVLEKYCQIRDRLLNCTNVDTGARLAGTYQFKLAATPKSSNKLLQTTMDVLIEPRPLPELESVASSVSEIDKGKLLPLSWKLKNFSELNQLQVFTQLDEGTPTLIKTYGFKNKQVPTELRPYCQTYANDTLTCSQVNLGLPAKAGNYNLILQAISQESQKQSAPSKPIPILLKAQPPKISVFTLNGKSSETHPSFFVKTGQKITLKWDIQGDDLNVKLEPLGDVSARGSQTLKATQGLSQITLTAQNEQGQSVNKAFLVQVNPPKSAKAIKEEVNPLIIPH